MNITGRFAPRSAKTRKTLPKPAPRDKEIGRLYEKIHEDQALGRLPEARFLLLAGKYDEEQAALTTTAIRALEALIDYRVIGQRIQKARISLGLTQEALAEKLQVSTNYLSKIETNKERPNLELLWKICVATATALSTLLTGVVEERHYLHGDIADILASCSPQKIRLIYDVILQIAQYEDN